MPYKFSTDYEQLFELISHGEVIAAFVEYKFREDDTTIERDICKVNRFNEYEINIGARGIGYGGLMGFNRLHGQEKELFIAQCKSLNLEWIPIKSRGMEE